VLALRARIAELEEKELSLIERGLRLSQENEALRREIQKLKTR